jgi:beta-1,4-mannosyl-glycoprotein beta-1,4-N-acetylglucosaminyltransferase
MIIDLFYFNQELDVLEIRLNILDKYVDKFVIVEARETFSGVLKPLYYLENKERFAKWNDKIIHCIVENGDKEIEKMALLSPNTGKGEHYWLREFYQKEYAQKALSFCNDSDVVFISDVDEIWKPTVLDTVIEKNVVYKPRQLPYLYYFNQRTSENWTGWTGTIFTRYQNIKNACINHLRTDSMTEYTVVSNGGWHFNSLGGQEKKRQAFQHPIYEDNNEWKRREVNMRIDESDLPEYLIKNKEKWKTLFL